MAGNRKSAQDRKAEIVATAIRLAGEHGPDRVTTQQLADAIGITQPAIFRHFPTKADIWLAVGKALTGKVAPTSGVTDIPDNTPDGDPLGMLQEIVIRHLRQIERTPAIPAILFSRELHAENEPLRRHFEAVINRRRAGLAQLIGQAGKAGHISNETNAADVAALLLAIVHGMAMRWSLENRTFDLVGEGTRLVKVVIGGLKSR